MTGGDVYSYKLEPVNTEWIHMADNHVSFANLPPGVYRLCVKAERYGQVATRELGLVVCPPWWRSLWAYLVYIVLAVVAFAFGSSGIAITKSASCVSASVCLPLARRRSCMRKG